MGQTALTEIQATQNSAGSDGLLDPAVVIWTESVIMTDRLFCFHEFPNGGFDE
jgi:hypothetical protein